MARSQDMTAGYIVGDGGQGQCGPTASCASANRTIARGSGHPIRAVVLLLHTGGGIVTQYGW